MAKNMLKNYGRFELLELIYNMRKENLELKERCEAAEKEAKESRAESERRLEEARKDFESRFSSSFYGAFSVDSGRFSSRKTPCSGMDGSCSCHWMKSSCGTT